MVIEQPHIATDPAEFAPRMRSVGSCPGVVMEEEGEHYRFAVRDLTR